jgi:hypothetical protein
MDFLTREDGTDGLSANVGKELPLCNKPDVRRSEADISSYNQEIF